MSPTDGIEERLKLALEGSNGMAIFQFGERKVSLMVATELGEGTDMLGAINDLLTKTGREPTDTPSNPSPRRHPHRHGKPEFMG